MEIRKFININLIDSYGGKNKGDTFTQPFKCFGNICTQRYIIHGFEIRDNVAWVYASRLDRKTGKIANKALLAQGFKFDDIFKSK